MGTLRRFSGAVASLDPAVATNNGSEFVVAQLYERLVAHPNGEPDPTPSLATAWTVSDDHRQYRFTLGDSQFHDGRPVTAADVAYSFERVASAPDSQHASLLLDTLGVVHETDDGAYVPGSLGVEAVDDRTVELRLVRPFHAALD
ncbi:MAG: ABC transporter substrate-binding protein, partial [Halobaculum sp.]